MRLRAPARGNRKLQSLLEAANADDQLKAWWLVQQSTATRLAMSDHSWIHVQIVLNVALRIFRLLERRGVQPPGVTHPPMRARGAAGVVGGARPLHGPGRA